MFNFVANASAVASLISIGTEVKSGGLKEARKSAITNVVTHDIQNVTGDYMLNVKSSKHSAMKETVRNIDAFTGIHQATGAISGFVKGACNNVRKNFPTVIFAIGTLAFKDKTAKTIGVAGMLGSITWDFIRNGTNVFTKTDIIEKDL